MKRDQERVERTQAALREASLDAVVCALPNHVLLLSGYWPVIGVSLAIATGDGQVCVLAPEDEQKMAQEGWADEVRTFRPASLRELRPTRAIVQECLGQAARRLGLGRGSTIGFETQESSVPAPYSALHLYGASLRELIQNAIPSAKVRGAGPLYIQLESVLTHQELKRVRAACQIAQAAFCAGAKAMGAGLSEGQIAHAFQAGLLPQAKPSNSPNRAGGWVWCMSGPNAARAAGAYACTGPRALRRGDLVLVHSNSTANGFWTDITRTFCIGRPDARKRALYAAVLEAFQAALETVRAGVTGAVVDQAARSVLKAHGFGEAFPHGTGHGVGFGAISHWARPRLHPLSEDALETGMVFNIEPAVYLEGFGGLRHCSMVALTEKGAEVLTPFQSQLAELTVSGAGLR